MTIQSRARPSGTVPFLRWAGGKRWLAKDLAPIVSRILTSGQGTYYEPFLGSGAIYFATSPDRAEISDINEDLISTYHWVRRSPGELKQIISQWPVDRETYYRIRADHDATGLLGAARFIYLNRTCYGGIHRTDRQGRFNTPYGGGDRTPDVLWRNDILENCAAVLRKDVSLRCYDFECMIDRAGANDVVFCDPTYSNVTKSQFDRYGAVIFGWEDQTRLARAVRRAAERGTVSIISNGAFASVVELYPDAYRLRRTRKKSIGRARTHGTDEEFLLIVDPLRRRRLWSRFGKIENARVHLGPQAKLRKETRTRSIA